MFTLSRRARLMSSLIRRIAAFCGKFIISVTKSRFSLSSNDLEKEEPTKTNHRQQPKQLKQRQQTPTTPTTVLNTIKHIIKKYYNFELIYLLS